MSLSNNPSRRQSTVNLRLARAVVAGAVLSVAVGSIGGGAGIGRLCSADRSPLRQRDRLNQCRP